MEEYNIYKRNKEGYIDIGFTSDAEDNWFFDGFEDIWKIEEALFEDGYFYENDIHNIDLNNILNKISSINEDLITREILREHAEEWGIKLAKIDFNTYASDVGAIINHFPGVEYENEVITRHLDSDFYVHFIIAEGFVDVFKNWIKLVLNEIIEAKRKLQY